MIYLNNGWINFSTIVILKIVSNTQYCAVNNQTVGLSIYNLVIGSHLFKTFPVSFQNFHWMLSVSWFLFWFGNFFAWMKGTTPLCVAVAYLAIKRRCTFYFTLFWVASFQTILFMRELYSQAEISNVRHEAYVSWYWIHQ